MLIFIPLENYHREFICSMLRLKPECWHKYMFICMYISCNTLGSWKRSFLTLENHYIHLCGRLKVQWAYLCIKKMLWILQYWCKIACGWKYFIIHSCSYSCLVNLYLVVYYIMKKSDFVYGIRWWDHVAPIVSRLMHSFKTGSPVANNLIFFTGDSNGLCSCWSDLG